MRHFFMKLLYNFIIMKYLLATDLDGTLLYPKRLFSVITNKNKRFLKRFLKNGNDLIIISGRNPKIKKTLSKKLKKDIPLIGCNGGYILKDGKFSYNMELPINLSLEIFLKVGFQYGIVAWFIFDQSDTLYVCLKNDMWLSNIAMKIGNKFRFRLSEKMIVSKEKFIERLKKGNCYKLMPAFGFGKKNITNAYYSYIALKDEYSDRLEIFWSKSAIEITQKNVSKGNCLSNYVKENNISIENVLVVGDSGNDLTMFNKFPHSFCMANGAELIKSKACHIVNSVSDIQKYIDDPSLMENDAIKE